MNVTRLGSNALLIIGTLGLLYSTASAAVTPEVKCEAGKNDASGKYAACISKAEKGMVSNGDAAKYAAALTKCEEKLTTTWSKLESSATAAGGACPSTGDAMPVRNFMDACVESVAEAVSPGGALPLDVASCNAGLGTCTGNLATCGSSLGTCGSNLSSCTSDLNTCDSDLSTCDSDLSTCDSDLASCDLDLAALAGEMRCPGAGIAGDYTIELDVPATCDSTIEFSGPSVISNISGCSNGAPSATMEGSIAGNVLTLVDEPSAICSGFRAEAVLTFNNDCDSASGTFSCRLNDGGPLLAPVNSLTATRN